MSGLTLPDDMEERLMSQYASPVVREQSASVVQVESSRLLPLLVAFSCVAMGMAGVAVGMVIGARDMAQKAEREARLQRLEIDEMKVALSVQGINTHEGSTP